MASPDTGERPVGSPSHNPWPCVRCGAPISVVRRTGRVPPTVLISMAALVILVWLGVTHGYSGLGLSWVLAVVALLLAIRLAFLGRAATAWRCERCGLRARPRLRPAGSPRPAIAIPTFNNADSIAGVVRRVRQVAPDLPLIVVDDGSTDETGERARQAVASAGGSSATTVQTHTRNRGKGAALRTALRTALARGYSHLVTLDGDGQHLPEDIPAFLAKIDEEPTALWVGRRDLSGDNVEGSSRFGRSFSNFWLCVLGGARLADSQCGFRVYPVAPTLSLATRARRFDFEVEVLTLAARAGMRLASVPIRVYYPPPSERVTHFDKLWDNVRISLLNTRLLGTVPLWPLGLTPRLSREDPPAAVVRPWSGRSRGGALGHLIFLFLIKALGPRPATLLLFPVALYFMFAAGRSVRASRQFLDRAVGPAPGPWRRFWRSYTHILTFSRCILDRAILQVRGARDFEAEYEGSEFLRLDGSGALFLSAHLGNYEVASSFVAGEALPIHVVMVDSEAETIKRVYERLGGGATLPTIIAINRSEFPALRVLAALRSNEIVALHGDRIIDARWIWCDFLGRPAAFPTGVFQIAAAARAPIVLTFGFKEGPRRYRFVAEPPRQIVLPREGRDAAIAEHVRWYAARLEEYARRYPMQWFNFYDFWAEPQIDASAAQSLG